MARIIGVDSETVAFSPGDAAPALVCIQHIEAGGAPALVTRARGAVRLVQSWLEDPAVVLVGHNVAYDAAVWCREGLTAQVFAAYRAGRIRCTWVYERLGEIAGVTGRKKLDLATTCAAHGVRLDGVKGLAPAEAKRLARTFGQFLWSEDIPEPWRTYALEDCAVLRLYERQARRFAGRVPERALELYSRRAFWCQLMSVWGLPTSPGLVDAFAADTAARLAELRPLAAGWGFIRPNGTRNMAALRAAVEECYGDATPRTATELASTSAQTLAESEDPTGRLTAFAEYAQLVKADAADVPMLRRGVIHPRYGMADTGRTTCSKPNMQNLPKHGAVRGCFVAQPGRCFLERDYSGIELCTFAQCCVSLLGRCNMARIINDSGDPGRLHAVVGGIIAGCSPDDLLKRRKSPDPAVAELAENARTRAKNGNFGFQGGLGQRRGGGYNPDRFIEYVRVLSKGAFIMTEAQSIQTHDAWAAGTGGDGPAYLDAVAGWGEGGADGTFSATSVGPSGLTRGGIWFCAAANFPFQNLAAEISAEAGWRLAEAQYLPGGALAHTRTVLHVHDSFVLDTPDDADQLTATDAIFDRILTEAAAVVMPDVISASEGFAARTLTKGRRVLDSEKRLRPWEG